MTEVEPERDVLEAEPKPPPFPLEDLLNPSYDWMSDEGQLDPRQQAEPQPQGGSQQHDKSEQYNNSYRDSWTGTTDPQVGPSYWTHATLDLVPGPSSAATTHWGIWAVAIPALLVLLCGALLYIVANL